MRIKKGDKLKMTLYLSRCSPIVEFHTVEEVGAKWIKAGGQLWLRGGSDGTRRTPDGGLLAAYDIEKVVHEKTEYVPKQGG